MAKNTHLEHLEDDIFNSGYNGVTNSINFLVGLRDMLTTGKGGGNTKVTVKWDGAPAIVCGTDPQTGDFFVGNKSVFNKSTPKICYTDGFIDEHYPSSGLNKVLKTCLKHLMRLPIDGVIQGDLLYEQRPPIVTMKGKRCYVFKPNTISYCVEVDSDLGRQIAKSEIGIVFHTRYSGSSIDAMAAGFGVNVKPLQGVDSVAVFSSEFTNVNGMANLSPAELSKINLTIASAKRNLTGGRKFLNTINKETGSFAYNALFKMYFNQVIRSGKIPTNSSAMAKGYISFVDARFKAEIAKKKTAKAQKDWSDRSDKALAYLNSNKSVMYSALSGFKDLMTAKQQIINKLKKIEGVGTFLEDENGYKVTSPEGFVAIKDGAALKLVDRLEFSRANFTVAKDWGK
jgi:hypothetical protein